jgi:hypothetical protein
MIALTIITPKKEVLGNSDRGKSWVLINWLVIFRHFDANYYFACQRRASVRFGAHLFRA